jgi:hypothetical protein
LFLLDLQRAKLRPRVGLLGQFHGKDRFPKNEKSMTLMWQKPMILLTKNTIENCKKELAKF